MNMNFPCFFSKKKKLKIYREITKDGKLNIKTIAVANKIVDLEMKYMID